MTCYATAPGRWASGAFWVDCYYQSSILQPELLIDSLLGRPNDEVQETKHVSVAPYLMMIWRNV